MIAFLFVSLQIQNRSLAKIKTKHFISSVDSVASDART